MSESIAAAEPVPLFEASSSNYQAIKFTGDTQEYFKVWIVNVALTVLTLGIYSAWAKVRKTRYFYTHTHLDGVAFDYHAKPQAILVGRLLAAAMIGLYWAAVYFQPGAELFVILLVFLISPWLVVRAKSFALYNTSHRAIRFGFDRDYEGSFKTFYGAGLLTVFTGGLGSYYAAFMKNRFIVNNSRYGKVHFEYQGESNDFLKIYLALVGYGFLFIILLMVALFIVAGVTADPQAGASSVTFYLMNVAIGIFYLALYSVQKSRVVNHVYNSTKLKDHSFRSTLMAPDLFGIYLTNILAAIVSLGLLIPWGSIRLARYKASCLEVDIGSGWDPYLSAAEYDGDAIGDEMAGAFDVDVGAGF